MVHGRCCARCWPSGLGTLRSTRGPRRKPPSRWRQRAQAWRKRLLQTPPLRWLRSDRYLLIHAIEAENALPAPVDDGLRCNQLDDLSLFRQSERWLTPQAFAADARRRVAEGLHLYTAIEGQRLLHYGWLVPRQKQALLSYVQQHYDFPEGSAVLFNAYTHPAARGQGLHERSMRRRVADAAALPGTRWIYMAIESHNAASRKVASRCGLRCVDVLFERIRFGRVERGRMSPEQYFSSIEKKKADLA